VTLRGGSRNRPGIHAHRAALTADEASLSRGIPVTSPARTIADLARRSSDAELERLVAEAQVLGLVTEGRLRAYAADRRGAARLRALLERADGPAFTRSEAERRFLALVRNAGLPAPRTNARVAGFEVDFLWPRARLVVELDGWRFHSSRKRFEDDRARGAALVAAGLRVLHVTWRQLAERRETVVARVAQALVSGATGAAVG
jgi:very-short-patch-repair endonuclease